ncbi:alpha/beta hydrolase [Empedobacter brevis]|uniref:alpha/beta hydrolase n=1 Tax=Empedobacter brevis TaxID=247 RepID=UPI0039AEC264
MKNIKNIDSELWQAISNSPYNNINYEELLEKNPSIIRTEELKIANEEDSLNIPEQLQLENIKIPSRDKTRKINIRTYQPKDKKDLPILVYFNGGAFIYGTPEQYDFIFFKLALDVNMIIVSVDYRLAPENPFPAAMEDGYDVLLWLNDHADQINGDRNKILIGGSSAGATIAASIAHLVRDKKELTIQHQYLLYPPFSHLLDTSSMKELANAPMQTKNAAKWMWKHYLKGQEINFPKYAVPLLENNFCDLPNATIIICEYDPLKDEGKLYAQKLRDANVSVNLLEIKKATHAFDFFDCQLSSNFYKQQVKIFKQILK